MKRQQKLILFFTLKKLAVEPEKHEDGLQNYNSLTQTITEMTQFKMPILIFNCGT